MWHKSEKDTVWHTPQEGQCPDSGFFQAQEQSSCVYYTMHLLVCPLTDDDIISTVLLQTNYLCRGLTAKSLVVFNKY